MHGEDADLQAMLAGELSVDGAQHSDVLLRFVDAVLLHPQQLEDARSAVRAAVGDSAFVDVCATVASFNAVVKVADATGIPLEDYKAENTEQLRAELKIDQLRDHGRFE